ncbi:MAG: DUF4332 domain-containing protein [Anaerolineae bacterium]|nr:DUF4332 domain-containing protein [Anaerolineae bacterium]
MLGTLSPLALLLIGFITGWVVEWAIDLWLRQRQTDAKVARLEELVREKDAELVKAQERVHQLEARLEELEEAQVAEAPTSFESAIPGDYVVEPTGVTIAVEESPIRSSPLIEQGDDLASLPGIGPAYARLLKEAGVFTYEDLARLDEQDLRTLLGVRPSWEGIDLTACLKEARRRAGFPEEKTNHEEAVKNEARLQTAWDDLTRVKGIGRTYAERLRAAGIHTLADLAALNEEELKQIIRPAAWQNVNLGSWIEQARALMARE